MHDLIVICGPTAVGKTAVALKLCKEMNGEIVSSDSQQVYRGMDIGTAKEDLSGHGVPCHLIDVVEPNEHFDAAMFVTMAEKAIADIEGRGRLPFIVGGTGLYIKGLLEGFSDAPGRDEVIREELNSIAKAKGRAALHDILRSEDPIMAEKLHPNDITRVIRAIEIKRLTGKSISPSPLRGEGKGGGGRYSPLKLGLNIDRPTLYDRINKRVDHMIERGLVEEVKRLTEKYGYDIQSLKAVGYKEIAEFLKGNCTLEKAIELTKRNTRRFAKRQLTWFKADPEIKWFHPDSVIDVQK